MAYATKSELADYLGVDTGDLPSDDEVERLLDRASELIDHFTLNRIDTEDSDHEEAARKAVCAQYEYWAELGDELGIMAKINSISIGSFSVSGGSEGAKFDQLADRAKQSLDKVGLRFSGVEMK